MSQTQQFRGAHTTITRPDAHTIRGLYHDTCVASFDTQTREVRLNHGGWKTNTTKLRMNQFANEFCDGDFNVVQINDEWFVNIRPEHRRVVYHNQTIAFTL